MHWYKLMHIPSKVKPFGKVHRCWAKNTQTHTAVLRLPLFLFSNPYNHTAALTAPMPAPLGRASLCSSCLVKCVPAGVRLSLFLYLACLLWAAQWQRWINHTYRWNPIRGWKGAAAGDWGRGAAARVREVRGDGWLCAAPRLCHITQRVINSPVGPRCEWQRRPFLRTHQIIMSPFAPRSSFVPTSLHLIMPIKSGGWGLAEGCGGGGVGRWVLREQAVLSHCPSLTLSIHVFIRKRDVILMRMSSRRAVSGRQMRLFFSPPSHCTLVL